MQIATSRTGRQDATLDPVVLGKIGYVSKLLGSHTLMQTFPIQLPDGREWVGTLWKTPSRRTGRRIQVRDHRGAGVFDTGDCYDQGNAANALEHWLQEQIVQEKSSIVAAGSAERCACENAVVAVSVIGTKRPKKEVPIGRPGRQVG